MLLILLWSPNEKPDGENKHIENLVYTIYILNKYNSINNNMNDNSDDDNSYSNDNIFLWSDKLFYFSCHTSKTFILPASHSTWGRQNCSSVYKLGKWGRTADQEILSPVEQTGSGKAAEVKHFPHSLEVFLCLNDWRNNKWINTMSYLAVLLLEPFVCSVLRKNFWIDLECTSLFSIKVY